MINKPAHVPSTHQYQLNELHEMEAQFKLNADLRKYPYLLLKCKKLHKMVAVSPIGQFCWWRKPGYTEKTTDLSSR